MTAWRPTTVRLSLAFRALLDETAPQAGDRAAALRALALLGAASVGLRLDDLRQELGGLLAVPLHEAVYGALAQLYLAEHGSTATVESFAQPRRIPAAVAPHLNRIRDDDAPHSDSIHSDDAPHPVSIRSEDAPHPDRPVSQHTAAPSNPFAIGVEV
jgi:hypothetical protein